MIVYGEVIEIAARAIAAARGGSKPVRDFDLARAALEAAAPFIAAQSAQAMAEIGWILGDYGDGEIREVRALGRISRVVGEFQKKYS